MAGNTLQALNTLSALTTLVVRSSEAAQRVSALIEQAQSEGRDISDAEIREVQQLRTDAMQRWNEQIGGS